MDLIQDTRDKVLTTAAEVKGLSETVGRVEAKLDAVLARQNEQRGSWKVASLVGSIAGGLVSAMLSWWHYGGNH